MLQRWTHWLPPQPETGKNRLKKAIFGFSLAEILVCVAILGILTAMAIPPLFFSGNSASFKNTMKTRDVAYMLRMAMINYNLSNPPKTAAFTASDLMPYLSYVGLDTSTTIDWVPNAGPITCNGTTSKCLKLQNGGILMMSDVNPVSLTSQAMGSQSRLATVTYIFDPDGVNSGNPADNISTSIQFELYYDGNLRTRGNAKPNSTCAGGGCAGGYGPNPAFDPSWFIGF